MSRPWSRRVILLALLLHQTGHALSLAPISWRGGRALSTTVQPRHVSPTLLAKKKGGGGKKKKGGKGGKQSGFAWASSFELKPWESSALREIAVLGCRTFQTRTGKPLHPALADAADVPKALWTLPVACVIVGHPTEAASSDAQLPAADDAAEVAAADSTAAASEAVYVYANLAAIEALGFADWQSAIGAPSALPEEMSKKYESGYSKKAGLRPVTLLDASRWVLEKAAVEGGKLVTSRVGLCYAWSEWQDEDGFVCEPGGKRRTPDPTPEELAAAIEEKGAEVRRLKEEEGLGNKDPQVQEAVAALLSLKAAAEELEKSPA